MKERESDELYPYIIVYFILCGVFLVSTIIFIVLTRLEEIGSV